MPFTPGPWQHVPEKLMEDKFHIAGRTPKVVAGDFVVAEVCRDATKNQRNHRAEDNARLIAAAPDLLAALEELVKSQDTEMGKSAVAIRYDLARELIARVRGS